MQVVLNVSTQGSTFRHVVEVANAWMDEVGARCHVMGKTGERTAVIEGRATPHNILQLARHLGEDAIAVWDTEREVGMLVGPRAHLWGRFNPALFSHLSETMA